MDQIYKVTLDIYKLLPLTDCGDCGEKKCLDFARQLLKGIKETHECPHLEEAEIEEITLIIDEQE